MAAGGDAADYAIDIASAIEEYTALHMVAGGVAADYWIDIASGAHVPAYVYPLFRASDGLSADSRKVIRDEIATPTTALTANERMAKFWWMGIAISIEVGTGLHMADGGSAADNLRHSAVNAIEEFTGLDMAPRRLGGGRAADFSIYVASAIEEFIALQMAAGGIAADYSMDIASEIEELNARYRTTGLGAANNSTGNMRMVDIAKSILEALMSSVLVFYKAAKSLGEAYQIEGAPWHQFLLRVRHELHDLVDGVICREKLLQSLAAYGKRDSGLVLRRKLGDEYEGFVQGFVELVTFANAKDVMGRTTLHHATLLGRGKFVKLLMWDSQFGSMANTNIADLDGHTALHLASRMGYEDVVIELMSRSTPGPSCPPASADQVLDYIRREEAGRKRIECLLDGKSYLQPNSPTSPSGRSAEILAAIGRDANKQEKDLGHERSGRSLLFMEVEKVFYYYMIIGARGVFGKRWRGESVWFEVRTGVTPLHYSVEHDHYNVVALLILHPKTDVFWLASDGQSPWTIAYPLCWNEKDQYTRVQHALTSAGSIEERQLNFLRDMTNDKAYKYLTESVKFHQQRLLKRAIELARADENDSEAKDRLRILERQIIWRFASRLNSMGLRRKDIIIKDARHHNLTLLQAAAFDGLGQEIEALLTLKRYREHVNETETFTDNGQTAFHFAVGSNVDAVAALLKEKTLDFSQQNEAGRTPIDLIQHVIDVALKMKKKHGEDGSTQLSTVTGIRGDDEIILKESQEIRRVLTENPLLVEKLYRDRQVFADAANAILVGAALIASVTFGGFLQPPLGFVLFNADESSTGTQESFAAVEQHISVRVFWAFNSLSFYSAIATVVAGGGAVLPTSRKSIEEEVRMVRSWLRGTSALLAISILCVLGAFTAAGFASLPNDFKYERNIVATGTIGLTLCVMVLILFFHRLFLSLDPLSPITIVISEIFGWIYFFIQLAIVVCCLLILFVFKLPYAIFYLAFNGCNVYKYFWLVDSFKDFFSFVSDILVWEKINEIYFRVWKEALHRG